VEHVSANENGIWNRLDPQAGGDVARKKLRRGDMYLRGHMQNAYVTHDVDRAAEMVASRFGIKTFDRFEPVMVVKTLHGERPLTVRVASAWVGGLNIELIEPVSGYVDHYVSLLPKDPTDAVPRFHHMSFRRDNEAAMREEIARLGLPLAFEGPLAIKNSIPSLIFIYLDARATLGHYVEFTWKSAEAWKFVGWPEGRPVI
jgi:Glyoxalase/Bleomycin resistance protein/Dioxygenase superfamily